MTTTSERSILKLVLFVTATTIPVPVPVASLQGHC
jgi:hypothetical protein